MSDFPEDILLVARRIARDAGLNYISMGPMGFIMPIARAILAERERCAQIAISHRLNTDLLLSIPTQSAAARDILNEIRSPREQTMQTLASEGQAMGLYGKP